jgi:hypothetical protein
MESTGFTEWKYTGTVIFLYRFGRYSDLPVSRNMSLPGRWRLHDWAKSGAQAVK